MLGQLRLSLVAMAIRSRSAGGVRGAAALNLMLDLRVGEFWGEGEFWGGGEFPPHFQAGCRRPGQYVSWLVAAVALCQYVSRLRSKI